MHTEISQNPITKSIKKAATNIFFAKITPPNKALETPSINQIDQEEERTILYMPMYTPNTPNAKSKKEK